MNQDKQKENQLLKQAAYILGSILLTACGLMLIPSIIDSSSMQLYKKAKTKTKVDYENMGPKIIRK